MARPLEPGPSPIHVDFRFAGSSALQLDHADAYRVLAGGRRFEVTDAEVRHASTVLYGDIGHAQRLGETWVYLAFDGSLSRSASFTSPLEQISGPLGGPFAIASERGSRRLMVHVEREEGPRLFTSAGGAFAPLEALGARGELGIFATQEVGLVRVVGGAVGRTEDGGATFHLLPLDAPARRIALDGERFVIELATPARLSDGGRFVVVDGDRITAVSERPEALSNARHPRVSDATNARAGRLLETLRPADEPRVRVLSVDESTDAGLDGCYDLMAWDDQRVAKCGREVRLSPRPGAPFEPVAGFIFEDMGSLSPAVSDDGRFAAYGQHCGEAPDDRDARALCLLDTRDSSIREVTLAPGAGEPVVLGDRAVLLGPNRQITARSRVFGLDGVEQALPGTEEERSSVSYAGGVLSVALSNGRGFAGPLGAELREIALPAGTSAFAMADAQRGLATGEAPDSLHVTRDGGVSFEPLELPIDGTPSALPSTDERGVSLPPPSIQCRDGLRCTVLLRRYMLTVEVEGFGRRRTGPRLSVVGPVPTDVERLRGPSTIRVGCELAERDTPNEEQPAEGPRVLRAAHGAVQLELSTRTRRLRWSSSTAPRFRARSAPFELPESPYLFRAGFADREVAIGLLCGDDYLCSLLHVRAGQTPRTLATGLREGRVIVHRSERETVVGVTLGGGLTEAFWLEPDGTLRSRRAFLSEPIALDHGGSLAFVARSAERSYAMTSTTELRPAAIDAPVESLTVCGDDEESPTWAVAVVYASVSDSSSWDESEQPWRLILQRPSGGPPCVARAESLDRSPGVLRPDDGALVGSLSGPGGSRSIRCTVEVARRP